MEFSHLRSQILAFALLAAGLILTGVIYVEGFSKEFHFDDGPNFSRIDEFGGLATTEQIRGFVLSGTAGRAGRPLSLLSFVPDSWGWPGNAVPFKRTNLLIHFVNALLIFWLLLILARQERLGLSLPAGLALAGATTLIWALHPYNTSTVLYPVQRMTQLASLFVLAGLIAFAKLRYRPGPRPLATLVLLGALYGLFLVLGVLSKESAILLPVYAMTCLVLMMPPAGNRTAPVAGRLWDWMFLAGPMLVLVAWFAVSPPRLLARYVFRDFSLSERLMTEARVVVDYLHYILVPRRVGTGLFHDDFTISTGLLAPVSTLACIVLILLLTGLAVLIRKREPVLSFAIFWFFGGHLLESTVIALEIYFEHRNYLPMVGPLLALVYYAGFRLPVSLPFRATIVTLFLALSTVALYQNTTLWANQLLRIETWRVEHPASARAQLVRANYWAKRSQFNIVRSTLEDLIEHNPKSTSAYASLALVHCYLKEPIPDEVFGKILLGLEQGYVDPVAGTSIQMAIDRKFSVGCNDIPLEYFEIMANALANNYAYLTNPKLFSQIYIVKSKIRSIMNDRENTLKYARIAFESTPTLDVALYYFDLAMAYGKLDLARSVLDRMKVRSLNNLVDIDNKWIANRRKRLEAAVAERNGGNG